MEAGDGGLPETSRSEILRALKEFDEDHRGGGRWANWQSNRNYRHAIEHEGRQYPVKQIVSMATGRPTGSLSASEQASSYVESYGFDVARLRDDSLRSALKEVLDIYVETRETYHYGKTDEDGEPLRIWELFEEIEKLLEESPALSQQPHVEVDWTLGSGRWVHSPWFAFLDERVTSTVREGFYPSFGLKPERSKINVGYIIGLDQVREAYGAQVGTAILQNRAERLRGRSLQLEEEGFRVPKGPAQKGDQLKVIAQKSYEEGEIPPDGELLSELDILLRTYDRHVSRERTGFSINIDRSRLNAAVDNIIRPAILERRDLEDNDLEGYQHQKIIPDGTPKLTPEALSESPRESVLDALRADVNLLSGNWQKSPAIKFFKRADPSAIQGEVSNLLYGAEELADRVERFMGWGEEREIEDGKTAGLGGTVASYLLFLSDPQQHAFCKTARAYRPAVKALLGGEEVRSDWPDRIAHARAFYRETLRVFQEEHEDLPFSDLMHVHIAFYLAENEDEGEPWGEGTIETGDSTENRGSTRLLIRSRVGSGWEGQEGQSYRFGQTTPSDTKVESGTKFLIDQSFSAGPNRIIAKGQFGDVEQTGTDGDGREEQRARYDQHEPILPHRPVMGKEESILERQEGYDAEDKINQLSQDAFEELAEPPTTWIFQANPDKFDVRGSLEGREGQKHTWTVNQYVDDIDVGDRVYLWESGGEGGIVGTAYVTEPVGKRAAFDWEKEFTLQEDRFEGEQERVVLRVDRAVEPPLHRDKLKNTPGLEDLSILQFAAATNFPVEPDEAETVERLLGTAERHTSSQAGGDRPDETQDLPPGVEEHRDLLLGEKQIIFAGPPGTSKTYGAFEIISALSGTYKPGEDPTEAISGARFSGDPGAHPTTGVVWDIVQFHQSYGYEDFVSGIEADTVAVEEGRKQLTFDREKRIFLQLVEAAQNWDVPHVLIIDEINRGALGRVFGELILTLEYRNLPVRLPGQNETIEIPENLYLIGTMNTADRNISLVDHALRRRFHFVERLPEASQLNRYLQQQGVEDAKLMLGAFDAIQSAFTGETGEYAEDARGYSLKDYAVGHTYFMVGAREKLWRNLTRQVIPLLEEYQKEGILTAGHLREAAGDLTTVISGEDPPPELTDWCERYRR